MYAQNQNLLGTDGSSAALTGEGQAGEGQSPP